MATASTSIRTALFVDFDQVFGGLHRVNPDAAEHFATEPERWMRFFAEGRHALPDDSEEAGQPRALLLRRVYLNPRGAIRTAEHTPPRPAPRQASEGFGRYRAYFTRAAFSVIDCPPLTSRGKNSADIQMVMDIVDALAHPTRFDEFIILSSDADFTPVLLRLRAHDRRTTILADVLTAAAYRAACDVHVTQESFIGKALGIVAEPLEEARAEEVGEPEPLLPRIAHAVATHVSRNGPTRIGFLTPVLGQFPEFQTGVGGVKWFGFGTLNRLVEEIARLQPQLRIDRSLPEQWSLVAEGAPVPEAAPREPAPADPALVARILDIVRAALADANRPIVLAHLAQTVMRQVPEVAGGRWPGGQRFADLLRASNDPRIGLIDRTPGYAFDPVAMPDWREPSREDAALQRIEPEFRAVAGRVHRVSDAPLLAASDHRALFAVLAEELARLQAQPGLPWSHSYLATVVREAMAGQGLSIAPDAVNFVFATLEAGGMPLAADIPHADAAGLAAAYANGVRSICESAQLEFAETEAALIANWLTGAETIANTAESGNGVEPMPGEPDGSAPAPEEAAVTCDAEAPPAAT